MASSTTREIPSSILIVGSGVFGLSTAYSLALNPAYANTSITLIDRLPFPAPDAASIDTSRIVRADYADIAYSALAFEAQEKWRNEWWGANDIYHEPGLAVKSSGGEVEALETNADIRRIFDDGPLSQAEEKRPNHSTDDDNAAGDFGYVNWRSGWADAEKAMRALRAKLEALNRVLFIHGTVARLNFSTDSIKSVTLSDNSTISATLTILATGAWTPTLLDCRGICSATGQILTYMPLTPTEQSQLERNPTLLNESTGLFIIPPRNNVLKIARHGYGYENPTNIPHPERPDSNETITVSIPRTYITHPACPKQQHHYVPPEGLSACRHFLSSVLPSLSSRPFSATRICWYTDTRTGDWIISYHPRYRNLFVATGGSGHAFKFLPVVGDRIVDTIGGVTPEAFRGKWEWPVRGGEEQVWSEDWRGGVRGMVLEEEMGRVKVGGSGRDLGREAVEESRGE
ncbi:FAD dependent oxidoreductase [Delphinella strobiligena]|nr:FAD dependent oxidoreductase [Delphinella strobiligena]